MTIKTLLAIKEDTLGQSYLDLIFFENSIRKRIWVQYKDDGRWINIGPLDDKTNKPSGIPLHVPIHDAVTLTDGELILAMHTMLLALTGYNRP